MGKERNSSRLPHWGAQGINSWLWFLFKKGWTVVDCFQNGPQLLLFLYLCCSVDETLKLFPSKYGVSFLTPRDCGQLRPGHWGRDDIMLVSLVSLKGHGTPQLALLGPSFLPYDQAYMKLQEMSSWITPVVLAAAPNMQSSAKISKANLQLTTRARGIPAESRKPAGQASPT